MAYKQSDLLPDDILSAILVLAKRKSGSPRLAFRGHDYMLQNVFYELTQQLEGELLKVFVYSDSGPEPYSPVLNDSVSRLQLSGLIGRGNPDYEVVFLNQSAEKYYDEVLKDLLEESQIAQLEKIADAFLDSVTTV